MVNTTATTYFRLQGILCPIADPLPHALSPDGRAKVQSTISGKENTTRHTWVSTTNALSTFEAVRLIGTSFSGATKDTNFWTETVTGSGTVTQSG